MCLFAVQTQYSLIFYLRLIFYVIELIGHKHVGYICPIYTITTEGKHHRPHDFLLMILVGHKDIFTTKFVIISSSLNLKNTSGKRVAVHHFGLLGLCMSLWGSQKSLFCAVLQNSFLVGKREKCVFFQLPML